MKLIMLRLCVAAAVCSLSIPAQAGTITENYGLTAVDFLSGNPVNSAVLGFNSTLGSLSSIVVTYAAGATLVQGNAISSSIKIEDPAGALLRTIQFGNMTGRAQQSASGTFNVPVADFPDFLNAGKIDLTLVPFTACRGSAMTPTGCSAFTGLVGGTVTYDFNPPAGPATPEPPSLAMLSAGLVAFGLWRRKAKSSTQG